MTQPNNPFIEHDAEHSELLGGDQWKFRFANRFGASVVRHDMSYGHRSNGLYEIGVLGLDGHLTYDTPITDDVLGWQTVEEVRDVLRRIAELPAAVGVSL